MESTNNRGVKRQIGPVGTCARVVIGVWLAGSVFYGYVIRGPFRPLPWIIGLVVFPMVFLVFQWARARYNPSKLQATGLIATVSNVAIFFYFLLWAPSPIYFMRDAVLLFYGVSMLVAAIRGAADCEAVAISNWLLRRDDQLGCLFFSPIDYVERKTFH